MSLWVGFGLRSRAAAGGGARLEGRGSPKASTMLDGQAAADVSGLQRRRRSAAEGDEAGGVARAPLSDDPVVPSRNLVMSEALRTEACRWRPGRTVTEAKLLLKRGMRE